MEARSKGAADAMDSIVAWLREGVITAASGFYWYLI
jgi:hypothetical protein